MFDGISRYMVDRNAEVKYFIAEPAKKILSSDCLLSN